VIQQIGPDDLAEPGRAAVDGAEPAEVACVEAPVPVEVPVDAR
jgi:hypothetical protein